MAYSRRETQTARPHGLSYSLTPHAPDGTRVVGFDNAYPVRGRSGLGGRMSERDHQHRLRTIRLYDYEDVATLLEDFWNEVDQILRERWSTP